MAASRFECPRCQTVFVKDIGDAAFVECPSCGALALPAGDATEGFLERALSGSQLPTGLASTEMEQRPLGSSTSAEPSDPGSSGGGFGGPGIFAGLLDGESGGGLVIPPAALPQHAAPAGAAPGRELDFDFTKDLEIDLPSLPVTTPPHGTSKAAPASSSSELLNPGMKSGPMPMPPVTQLPPEALAALAREAEAGPTDAQPAPWSGLSEDAFGDLEKAFDEMALKPVALPRGGLSADEERFLRSDGPGASRPPPLRRVDGEKNGRASSRPPPRRGAGGARGSQRPRPTHFELSDEARSLAFIALKADDSVLVARPRGDVRRDVGPDLGPAAEGRPASSVVPAARSDDGDRAGSKDESAARKPVPSAFQGLSFMRVLALIVVFGIAGGVGGALTAPAAKPAATARARAELRFADGNRFYDAGRYDDALGAFRGALSIDPTFGLAHRAKGAALAKLSRFDEALGAYEEYLKLEPNAVDVADVKAAIARRGPAPDGRAP